MAAIERKKVFFVNQNKVEYWSNHFDFGSQRVLSEDGDDWEPSTFSYVEIRCCNQDFENRVDGCICW